MQLYSDTRTALFQQSQEQLWLLIALTTPLLVNLWVEQQFEASKIWLLRTLVWTLVWAWLGGWMTGSRPKTLPRSIRTWLLPLLFVLLLATALSPHGFTALFGSLDRASGLLTQVSYLLLFVCLATRLDGERSQRLLTVTVLTGVPICLLGLAQAAGWQPLSLWTDARSPLTTTLGRANFTGAYLALLLPLTLTAAWVARKPWQRRGYIVLVGMEIAVLLLSQARAAWIAAVVGVGVLLWLGLVPRWTRRTRWISALGGIAVAGGALLLVFQRGIAAGGSVAARWTIWQASLKLLWPRLWLGYGPDTLELHFPGVYPPQLVYYQGRGVVVDRAHNWLLDWSLSYGVVATILLCGLIYAVVRTGWRQMRTRQTDGGPPTVAATDDTRWLAACIAVVLAQLVGNLFLFEVAATAVVFWISLAVLVASALCPAPEARALALSPLWQKVALAAGACIVGWAVWHGNVRPLLADASSWQGTQAARRGQETFALAAYIRAAEFQPQRASYHAAVALMAARSGSASQAERAMKMAIRLRPMDPVLHRHLATIYAGQGAIEAAYAAYDRAVLLAPTIGLTYREYAGLALRTGDHSLALRLAQRAVDLDATDGQAYGILGWAELGNGSLEAARSAFAQAIDWAPNVADFHLGLATVFYHQGNLPAARRALQQALAIDPNYPPALTLAVQLR